MKLNKGLFLFFLVVLAGLMVLGGCNLFGGEQSTPERTVQAYFEAFNDQDFQKVNALTVEGQHVSAEEIEMMEAQMEGAFQDFQIDYVIEGTEMISDTEADVRVTMTTAMMGQESTHTESIRVVKQDGKWYIDEAATGEDEWDDDPMEPDYDFDDDMMDPDDGIEFDEEDLEDLFEEELDGLME